VELTGALEVNREHILTSQNMRCKPCYETLKPGSKHKTIQHHPVAPDPQEPSDSPKPSQPTARDALRLPTHARGGVESFTPGFPYLSHLFCSALDPSE